MSDAPFFRASDTVPKHSLEQRCRSRNRISRVAAGLGKPGTEVPGTRSDKPSPPLADGTGRVAHSGLLLA